MAQSTMAAYEALRIKLQSELFLQAMRLWVVYVGYDVGKMSLLHCFFPE